MGGDNNNNQEIIINFDVVPADNDEYEEPPELDDAYDSSDDESYAPDDEYVGEDNPDELEDVMDKEDDRW